VSFALTLAYFKRDRGYLQVADGGEAARYGESCEYIEQGVGYFTYDTILL
jgi:hypothetical protein